MHVARHAVFRTHIRPRHLEQVELRRHLEQGVPVRGVVMQARHVAGHAGDAQASREPAGIREGTGAQFPDRRRLQFPDHAFLEAGERAEPRVPLDEHIDLTRLSAFGAERPALRDVAEQFAQVDLAAWQQRRGQHVAIF